MSATLTMGRITAAPPYFKAKVAGVLYVLGVLAAALAEIFVRGKLNVAGDLVAFLGMIAVTLLFNDVLSPVSRSLSLLAVSFNLIGLVFEALRLQPHGVNIAIVFDGFYCILIGCVAFRSTFLSRTLGALTGAGGLAWLTFLSPRLANYLSPYNLASGLLGGASVCLWILLIGLNARRRNERATLAGERRSQNAVRI
jgi:hypothetical protein